MTSELVPTENMAMLDQLSPEQREVAVTHMLDNARMWLATAVESTEPQEYANFKAFVATVAETTKQLNLSKSIQTDAALMVRRAERGVGKAIRKGQEEGTVGKQGRTIRRPGHHVGQPEMMPVSEMAGRAELHGDKNTGGIYAMTDGVSDEQFEEALDAAKTEGNPSRANVVRKIRREESQPTKTPPPAPDTHTRPQPPKYGGNRLKHLALLNNAVNAGNGLAFGLNELQELDTSVTAEEARRLSSDLTTIVRSIKRIQNLLNKKAV